MVALMISGMGLPLGGLILFLGVPTAMAVLSMRVRSAYALLAAAVAVVLASFVISPINAVIALPSLIMGVLIGVQLSGGAGLYDTSAFAALSSVVTLLLLYASIHMLDMVTADEMRLFIEASVHHMFAYQSDLIDPATLSALVTVAIQLLPAAVVFFHFVAAMISTVVTSKISKRIGLKTEAEPFLKLILSHGAGRVTVLATTLFFLLFLAGMNNLFIINATALVFYMTGVVGIAGLVGLLFVPHRKKAVILITTLLMHFIIGPMALYIYAIVDSRYDFRGVRRA